MARRYEHIGRIGTISKSADGKRIRLSFENDEALMMFELSFDNAVKYALEILENVHPVKRVGDNGNE